MNYPLYNIRLCRVIYDLSTVYEHHELIVIHMNDRTVADRIQFPVLSFRISTPLVKTVFAPPCHLLRKLLTTDRQDPHGAMVALIIPIINPPCFAEQNATAFAEAEDFPPLFSTICYE